ncbi:MAG: transcriptional repressor LexA [Acidobacteriota bacterium]
MIAKRNLTRRQALVLRTLTKFVGEEGYAPSMRELAASMGVTVGTAHFHVHSLMKRGYLLHDGSDHGITLLPRRASERASPELPMLGTIVAGLPLDLREEPGESIEVPESLARRATYALRVRGDSMKDDGIIDGDYVLVERRDSVENGQIAVVLLPDGTATLKRVFKERHRYRLQPANLSMTPTYVPKLKVQGRVLAIIRHY